jgi:hypothetical protein
LPIQRKLEVGAADDPLEREADQAAELVMRMPIAGGMSATDGDPILRRKCGCDGSSGGGECQECRRCAGTLQRAPIRPIAPRAVPRVVHDVLRSPGQPLDPTVRAFMEPRFGLDFSDVRVHTDSRAAASARAVNALAYTVGRDVVFGAGQYEPSSSASRRLLAHELIHVSQQTRRAPNPSAQMSPAPDVSERGRQETTNPGEPARRWTFPSVCSVDARLSRFVPAEVEPPPVATPAPGTAVAPGSPGGALPTPAPSQRYAASPSDLSLDELWDRANKAPDIESAKDELETPVATADRGGTGPDFVTTGPQAYADWAGGAAGAQNTRIYYIPHQFRALDALEDDVSNAKSSLELIWIYSSYFPDSTLRFGLRRDLAAQWANKPLLFTHLEKLGKVVYDPTDFDPDGSKRENVFTVAAAKKTSRDPSITTDALLKSLVEELVQHEAAVAAKELAKEQQSEGECQTQAVPHAGGNPDHDKYADKVTRSTQDFRITTPAGTICQTDGVDAMNPRLVWEVKTGHEWATSYGVIGSIFAPGVQHAIYELEEQKNRCSIVTQRCGFDYWYAFATAQAADFMNKLWSPPPPTIRHVPQD